MNATVSVLLLGIISMGALVLVLYWSQKNYRSLFQQVSDLLQKSQDQNQKLVAMLASRDPMTAVAMMETLSPSETAVSYVPMSDEAEAARYQAFTRENGQGLGEAVFNDSSADNDLADLGIGGEESII